MRPYRLHQAAAFKLRGILMVPVLLVLFFCTEREWEYELGVWIVGLAPFVAGVALRVWAQRHLKYRLRVDHGLATTGPYAFMRNPVYVGNLLILAGLCVTCELPWMIPLVCGWAAIVYDSAVRFEEVRLRKRHGDAYAAYCGRVHRWWPRAPSAGAMVPSAETVCTWARAAAVEWQCLALLLIPAVKELFHPYG